MSSLSQTRFLSSVALSRKIRETAKDSRLRPISREHKTNFLHAALAAYVAGWDAYLKQVTKEFVQKIYNPHDVEFASLHSILEPMTEQKLKKFNTPNWDNSRDLLISCTGYDPIADWVWRAAQFNRQQSQDFLNQILKVRHSFAHGFSIPTFQWTQTPSGKVQLNDRSLERVDRFLTHLVIATDIGLLKHGSHAFPSKTLW
ncbi:HEPN domain-containing protein [Azospirillum brasilense]|uniref:HEPN domain-containing protein n=1 Tax=Azospirillum brasilense TaxID=192 RepID=UPI00119EE815|nr:HEPN domain-containing protein [Azospirillum brasilense]